MLLGEYQHSLDDKGRLTMPARFREKLGDSFIVTKGLDSCLFVFPMAEWKALEERLKTLPMTQASARAFVRILLSGATECTFDKQGRVLLPPGLREYARLQREAVVIGLSSRAEIWAREEWERYVAEAQHDYNELAEKLVDLGI